MTPPFPAGDAPIFPDKVTVNKHPFLPHGQIQRPISSGPVGHRLCLLVAQPGCCFLRAAKKQLLSRIGVVVNSETDSHDRMDNKLNGFILQE